MTTLKVPPRSQTLDYIMDAILDKMIFGNLIRIKDNDDDWIANGMIDRMLDKMLFETLLRELIGTD